MLGIYCEARVKLKKQNANDSERYVKRTRDANLEMKKKERAAKWRQRGKNEGSERIVVFVREKK
ncbi:uncharacterized protein G2W53_002107 [Senna tora]|uniref:Uncharacterized protein n=1 Tax=Senna tora TaxID=362788 RepID=A0A834XHJ1_9FABA|nr:uncharacterized protein G2W53_002107 [Senna tora]